MYKTLDFFYQTLLNFSLFHNIKWVNKNLSSFEKYDIQDGGQELQSVVAWKQKNVKTVWSNSLIFPCSSLSSEEMPPLKDFWKNMVSIQDGFHEF